MCLRGALRPVRPSLAGAAGCRRLPRSAAAREPGRARTISPGTLARDGAARQQAVLSTGPAPSLLIEGLRKTCAARRGQPAKAARRAAALRIGVPATTEPGLRDVVRARTAPAGAEGPGMRGLPFPVPATTGGARV
jgi:hypothetical protein